MMVVSPSVLSLLTTAYQQRVVRALTIHLRLIRLIREEVGFSFACDGYLVTDTAVVN